MAEYKNLKKMLNANDPQYTPDHPTKKMVVKAVENGKEKIVRFGAKGYKHNYSDEARKNFRARHNCDDANSKLTAKYWACKALWSKNSPKRTKE